jgi:hypothetical protein
MVTAMTGTCAVITLQIGLIDSAPTVVRHSIKQLSRVCKQARQGEYEHMVTA